MPDPQPRPGPEGEQPEGAGGPRFAWAPGSAETGPVTWPAASPRPWPDGAGLAGSLPVPASPVTAGDGGLCDGALGDGAGGDGAPADGGPSALDGQALLEALAVGGFLDGDPDEQDAVLAEELDAERDGRMGPPLTAGQVAGLTVEHMPPGPAMAGWLDAAARESPTLDEYALAGMAIAAGKLTSWAQGAGLAAVGQITARAAAADPRIGLASGGCPARVCRDAVGRVSLALTLTDYAATCWADLAVVLAWRLPATGAALACGRIDLARARVITDATAVLGEQAARAVEEQILPGAGQMTRPQLYQRLRYLVIAADPQGAERRREQAERAAKVSLYPDPDGTVTLSGSGLPQIEAAAAMARITAIARAMKAAGQGGGLDLHRARAMLGLLLGTLPYIPPPGGAPEPPPPAGPQDPGGPGGPGGPDDHGGPADQCEPGGSADQCEPGGSADHDDFGGSDTGRGAGEPWDDRPGPRDDDVPSGDGLDDGCPDDGGLDHDEPDDPEGDGDLACGGPVPAWSALGLIPPGLVRPAAPGDGRPVPGLLDVTLPWTTWTGLGQNPGLLARAGPVTATQARRLAAAAADSAAVWRVIVTNPAGQALTVTRIRRRARGRSRDGPPGQRPPPGAGLVGRITITIPQDALTSQQPGSTTSSQPGGITSQQPAAHGSPGGLAAAVLRAATRALGTALAQAAADAAAGGCAHVGQASGYRPPPRLREHVTARDVTCRNPVCRQPAWRADLDHTTPYDQGGRTYRCNLGGGCRRHHQLKQHPRWKVEQTSPGIFCWTTPAGRSYVTQPDEYPV